MLLKSVPCNVNYKRSLPDIISIMCLREHMDMHEWTCMCAYKRERESKQVLCDQVRACACVCIISSYIHL